MRPDRSAVLNDSVRLTAIGTLRRVRDRRRLLAGVVFAVVSVTASVIVARRLTHTSWPLAHAHVVLVCTAATSYLASFVLRALGWRQLFPRSERPHRARCLASVGAAAASGVVLPFRLDYLVKVGMLRRLGGVRVRLEVVALSILSLGLIDGVAMLPLSISATATSSSVLRAPLLIVVVFGIGCCALVVFGKHLLRIPLVRHSSRLRPLVARIDERAAGRDHRSTLIAWLCLTGCWTTRAIGSAVLLSALGVDFSPVLALCVLCLGAAAGLVPITAGGAIANAGATAGILLLLGVGRSTAINFSLASGMLLVLSALAATAVGLAIAASARILTRRQRATALLTP